MCSKIINKVLRLKSPLIVQFEITPECNNRCKFCYNFWLYDEDTNLSQSSPVEEKKIRKLFDVLLEHKVFAVCFTGGEPMLAENVLYDLLGKANKNGLYTSMNTHGRSLTAERVKKLKDSGGINSVLVSLHGDSKEVHGEAVGCQKAFSETVEGIENLLKAKVNVTVNFVATQKNVERIEPTAKFLRNIGVRRLTVTPLLPFPGVKDHKEWAMKKEQFRPYFNSLLSARNHGLKVDSTLPVAPCVLRSVFPDDYLKYLEVLTPRVCMAGVTFMVVSPEGVSRACIQAPQLNEYGGDISKSFNEAWEKANKWSRLDLLVDECSKNCYALASCGGGCRTSSLSHNGATYGKTMYMGEPLGLEEAEPFIDRMEVRVDLRKQSFRKRRNVKFREEEFGGVLANTKGQSFVMLDKEGVEAYKQMPDEFTANKNHRGLKVLYAAGILQYSEKSDLPYYSRDVSVIHASRFYPRLAHGLQFDKKVRMLRADTGERIFF